MSPAEVAWRVREQALRRAWARRQVRPEDLDSLPPLTATRPASERRFTAVLPPGVADLVPGHGQVSDHRRRDRLLNGEWEMLGAVRSDMEQPDWFRDPVTGRRSAPGSLRVLSQSARRDRGRQHQAGMGGQPPPAPDAARGRVVPDADEDDYAERVADQLRSWWRGNPFLSGINWTSGIELGIRLINFVWIRRLLDGWPGAADLFERSDLAVRQIRWHQEYLAAFESRGSSANNHVIAEAAGQLAASCAFPWFADSERSASPVRRHYSSDPCGRTPSLQVSTANLPRTTTVSSPNSASSRPLEAAAAGMPVSDACLAAALRDDRRHGGPCRCAAPAAQAGRFRRGPRGAP